MVSLLKFSLSYLEVPKTAEFPRGISADAKAASALILTGVFSLILISVPPKMVFTFISFDPSVKSISRRSITELPNITLYSLYDSFWPLILLSLNMVVFSSTFPRQLPKLPNSIFIPIKINKKAIINLINGKSMLKTTRITIPKPIRINKIPQKIPAPIFI